MPPIPLSWDPEHATQDTLWQGQLTLWQPARGAGYRFNLDPVLLSGSVAPGGVRALELGTGCGVLAILLLARGLVQHVTAVELQPDMSAFAQQNAIDNGFADRMQVVCGDLRALKLGDVPRFDRIVFNPPYFPAHAGPPSPHAGRDMARHERHGTLDDFVQCALHHAIAEGAHISAIIRPERVATLQHAVIQHGGIPDRIRHVVPRINQAPTAAIVRFSTGSPSSATTWQIEPPLIVHRDQGRDFTDDVEALLKPLSRT